MKKFTEFLAETKEPKPVNRIRYDHETREWHHSKNGGFTWHKVTPEEAHKADRLKYKMICQDHGLKLVKEDGAAPVTCTAGVAGVTGDPPVSKKAQKRLLKSPSELIRREEPK